MEQSQQETEARMVKDLVAAMTPILLPEEQQQPMLDREKNRALVEQLARIVWRTFARRVR